MPAVAAELKPITPADWRAANRLDFAIGPAMDMYQAAKELEATPELVKPKKDSAGFALTTEKIPLPIEVKMRFQRDALSLSLCKALSLCFRYKTKVIRTKIPLVMIAVVA